MINLLNFSKKNIFLATCFFALIFFFVLLSIFTPSLPQVDKSGKPDNSVQSTLEDIPDTTIEEIREQEESDRSASESIKILYEKYPWYDSFPIQEKSYFIGFDPSQAEFFIGINLYATSESEEQIKKVAEERINSLGIDLKDFRITYKSYR